MAFEIRAGVCILRLQGRFTMGRDAEYQQARPDLRSSGCRMAIADMREVPYIDSTGLTFIVGLYHTMKDMGGRFALANVSPRIREVLELTRLDEVIPVLEHEDWESASAEVACAGAV